MATLRHKGGEDRLSALPDATLTRILAHLPTDQAVRTSTLSRRWRHVFTAVPVVDLSAPPRPPNCRIDHMVNSVLLSRDGAAPIRSFRVVGFSRIPSGTLIDQWIGTALFGGAETIELDLPPPPDADEPVCDICPPRQNGGNSSAPGFFSQNMCTMPRHLFSSNAAATLRHLRLGNCKLDLPEHEQSLSLGSLETLSLRRINAPEHTVQRLISGCPRLVELTLDECPTVKRISVVLLLLRTFTIRCCYNATRVFVDAPSLRSLGYKGSVPTSSSVLSLANWERIEALAVDLSEMVHAEDSDKIRRLRQFVDRCPNLASLRLSSQENPPFFVWHGAPLPGLTQLELRGPFRDRGHIAAVADILGSTTNLEVLTLVIDQPRVVHASTCRVNVPKDVRSCAIECFRRTLRRIHLVKYGGNAMQRRLAKFLLRKAVCVEELRVTFSASVVEGSETETLLMNEMVPWRRNPRTRIINTRR